ncbi:MAG: C40 family peptidase [Bacteroidales bacterium]|nr:C40 family peptidase [Bacteroidales bacterium]
MRNSKYIFFVLVLMLLASCGTVQRMTKGDMEEEDFIIGKLYEDELVKEQPYVPKVERGKKPRTAYEEASDKGKNKKLYAVIKPWMGVPYKYGGTTKQGIDCSGFVGNIYREAYGITLHRTANDMQQDVKKVSKSQLREGDLVFFVNSHGKVSHVGIYLHDGLFVHSSTSRGVIISPLSDSYWSQHFHCGGRHPKAR